ncbi:MAG TPA: nucleoside-triphosphatase, partial [Thermoanaerobaculia bacterium]|nr:nucleoside-triphosphatase [Thermoanaerobaculia bacterium]
MAKNEPHALLLTGPPGIGKTTALLRAAALLSDLKIRGFTTGEIREAGERRVGFRLETFDGDSAVLAHVNVRSPHKVGKYGVDLAPLERVAADQLSGRRGGVVLLDEIGKMETLSKTFVEAVESLLESRAVLVATVGLRGGGFIATVKRRPDVLLWTLS